MKLYFGGGEVLTYKNILMDRGSPPVSVSYTSLAKGGKTDLKYFYPGEVFFDSGAYTYNRPDSKMQFEDAYESAAQYMQFIEDNKDQATLVSEFDARQLGRDVIQDMRKNFYVSMLPPEKFMPIWHPDDGKQELETLCSSYPIVGITQNDIHGDTSNVHIFNQIVSRYGVRLHGVGITAKKLIESVKWDSVSSTAWLSTAQYGETFVWTGRELKRYPKSYKDRARRSHRNIFEANGFSYDKIMADEDEELLKLSIWSWQQYISYISGVTPGHANKSGANSETAIAKVDNQLPAVRTESVTPRETMMLPVMSTMMPEHDDFTGEEDTRPVLIIRSESMRVCDSCFLRDKCPGFQPNSTCLYNIPIEIKTTDQLQAVHDGLLEMQTQRVLFMKMAEDIGGGYADPNLSSEMDRLNRMIKTKMDSSRNTFSMTINASEAPARPSFMSKMLGAGVSEKLRELEAPIDADDIIDAEIVQ